MDDRSRLETAWFCWAVPAFIGVGATIFHWLTGNPSCVVVGLLCVPLGVLLFIVGLAHAVTAKSGRRGLMILLLFSNFPLALACAWVGLRESFTVSVTVVNESDQTIDSALATFNGGAAKASAIPPKGSATLKVSTGTIERCEFTLSVATAGRTLQTTLGSYDSDDLIGGAERLRIPVTNEGFGKVTSLP